MDLQIVKDATPQVQLVNGQADIAYSLVVKNNGPNQAHNVVVSDAAPSGVTFLAVTTQPVGGSCTVTSALLDCSLGTLGPGVDSDDRALRAGDSDGHVRRTARRSPVTVGTRTRRTTGTAPRRSSPRR